LQLDIKQLKEWKDFGFTVFEEVEEGASVSFKCSFVLAEGVWKNVKFEFRVSIQDREKYPEFYPMVKSSQLVFHPNIAF
jgi:ubiquitin-protein ligase